MTVLNSCGQLVAGGDVVPGMNHGSCDFLQSTRRFYQLRGRFPGRLAVLSPFGSISLHGTPLGQVARLRLDPALGLRVKFDYGSGKFLMSSETSKYLKFGGATVLILLMLGYLAYTGVQESKSYYVTIKELHGMGDGAYTKRLRVAGNVQPGSIKRSGTQVEFILVEQDLNLPVSLYRNGSAAGHVQRQLAGAGRRQLRTRWRVSCQAIAGEVRLEVCARKAGRSSHAGTPTRSRRRA